MQEAQNDKHGESKVDQTKGCSVSRGENRVCLAFRCIQGTIGETHDRHVGVPQQSEVMKKDENRSESGK